MEERMLTKILTNDQIKSLHEASLAILKRIGVVVPHQAMLERFADSGAEVDLTKELVRIPEEHVMRSLNQAGKKFTLYGRDLNQQACFGQGKRNYNSIAGEALWLDEIGGERRYPSRPDVASAAFLGEKLDHINIVGAMADPHELPIATRCVEVLAALLDHTTKPITFWFHDRSSARFINEIIIALRGSEQAAAQFPICYPFLEPISPLRFPFNGIDLLFETSRLNMPVPIGPMAQMGMSAPATMAGTMAVENAEILAGICITQLIRPGLPVCYGGICHAFDMATTQMIFSGPEQAIFGVAMTQMGKFYGLPVYINAGLTDSKRLDAQAGLEAGVTLALGAAAGADIFGHMGICGVDQAASLDLLILQNEIIGYVESTMREIDLSDEVLGLDALLEVGAGGTFIDHEHTAQYFRKELWFPKLLDRDYYQTWLGKGGLGIETKCSNLKKELLKQVQAVPLPEPVCKTITEIVRVAKDELCLQ
jgi:trimethylamine--corrinoid protein Co-methyltransferase